MPELSRVLVTGSRDWTDRELVFTALDHMADVLSWALVIVHGGCPTGADAMAELWADQWDGTVATEPHPADWQRYGRNAGPIRNQEMVRLGAVICLAFPLGQSKGTRGCMSFAREASIPIFDYSQFRDLRAAT